MTLSMNASGNAQFIKQFWEGISSEALAFTKRLMAPDVDRPSALEAMNLPWISGRKPAGLPQTPKMISSEFQRRRARKIIQLNPNIAALTAQAEPIPLLKTKDLSSPLKTKEFVSSPATPINPVLLPEASLKPESTRRQVRRHRVFCEDSIIETLTLSSANDDHNIGEYLARMTTTIRGPGLAFRRNSSC